jgi:hypothetical protein
MCAFEEATGVVLGSIEIESIRTVGDLLRVGRRAAGRIGTVSAVSTLLEFAIAVALLLGVSVGAGMIIWSFLVGMMEGVS